MIPTISFASDVHIGMEDRAAVSCWLESVRVEKPDVIILGGDWMDCEELWHKRRGLRAAMGLPKRSGYSLMEEVIACKTLIAGVRHLAPSAQIVYLVGNHEERLPKMVSSAMPELWQYVPTLAELLDLGSQKVQVAESVEAYGWNIHHGTRYGVNPHRLSMQDNLGSVLFGHGHAAKLVVQPNLRGTRQCYGVMSGCLCQPVAEYISREYPAWSQSWTTLDPIGAHLAPNLRHIRRGQSIVNRKAVDGSKLHLDIWQQVDSDRRKFVLEQANL